MVELAYEGKASYPSGRVNQNYDYFKFKGRRLIKNRDFSIGLAWSNSGHLLMISRSGVWGIAGHTKPKHFMPQRLIEMSRHPTLAELAVADMVYPRYAEFVEDFNLLQDLISQGEKLDNDFDTLLLLCQQAEEKFNESERSLQTS